MLVQLKVKNFALIEEALLDFSKGLNVLTGETGAGKSIVIEALGFALGNRLESTWLRPGKTLSVEAIFQIEEKSFLEKELKEKNLTPEEGLVIIKRSAEGTSKTRSFLNGVLSTASQLKQIAPRLVDIFGQRESESLYDTVEQALLLDMFAGLQKKIESFKKLYEHRVELLAEKQILIDSLTQKEREMDLLQYQIKEIEAARINPEKDEGLEELKIRLNSAEKLGNLYRECAQKLSDDENSLLSGSGQISRLFTMLTKIDPSKNLKRLQEEAESLEIKIGELSRSLDDYGESLEHDPERLEAVMERIDLLDSLKKKYGKTLEDILRFFDEAKNRFTLLESSDKNLKKFDEEIEKIESTMSQEAAGISRIRTEAASKIEKMVTEELESLEMKQAHFKVLIEPTDFHSRGKDRIEFLLSANKGEALKPLAKVASGGEASRIQLAIKKCFSKVQPVSTLVFDEIDSGIGGRLGPVIGRKLEEVALNHAVISITHLAPVASHAACHWNVIKRVAGGKTQVQFEKLEGDPRIQEIAKMLSGKDLTETSLKHAKEILRR